MKIICKWENNFIKLQFICICKTNLGSLLISIVEELKNTKRNSIFALMGGSKKEKMLS